MNRKLSIGNSQISQSRGAVLVELALIIPLLLALSFGSFELAKVLKRQHKLSEISRQGAIRAFRGCSPQSAGSAMVTCLNAVQTDMNAYIGATLSGAQIVMSVFRRIPDPLHMSNPTYDKIQLQGISGLDMTTGHTPTGGFSSHFTHAYDPLHPDPNYYLYEGIPQASFPVSSITRTNDTIAIAEVYYTYSPGTTPIFKYFSFFSKSMYESTIM